MVYQHRATGRTAASGAFATDWGASPVLRIYNHTSLPADPASAEAGTKIAEGILPSSPFGTPSGGAVSKNGTWTLAGTFEAGAGLNATYFRAYLSGGSTCVAQGTAGAATTISTSAITAVNGNVLTFASVPATVVVGQKVTASGVPAGSTVVAKTGTTVTISRTCTAGVASAASVLFSYDMTLDIATIGNGMAVNVATFSITAGNA